MFLDYWDDVAKKDVAETFVKRGLFASTQQYLDTLPKEEFHLHFLPFAQGMLYVGNLTQLKDEELNLCNRWPIRLPRLMRVTMTLTNLSQPNNK